MSGLFLNFYTIEFSVENIKVDYIDYDADP